jgi:hypothetical protein
MLSAIANAVKSAQNCLKLPKTTKVYPRETINSKNFESSPKIGILVFFKKNFHA